MLILGSFPSVKSREQGFFYGHPRNRFWPMIAALFGEALPPDTAGRAALALRHHLALWDVIAACDIEGSADAAIRNPVPTDLRRITAGAPIAAVLCNGALSGQLYARFQRPLLGLDARVLPSTSPANATWTLPRLSAVWGEALRAAGLTVQAQPVCVNRHRHSLFA